MSLLKWIGVFFLYWIIGSIIALIFELSLFFLGGTLGEYGSGFVILLVILFGLFRYGKKQSRIRKEAILKEQQRREFREKELQAENDKLKERLSRYQ